MEPTQKASEPTFLDALRTEYESKGYSFYAHPDQDRVPKFLAPFKPDAIAISQKDSIVIEVKNRREARNEPRLSELAKLVQKEPGWRLRVYYRAATTPRLYDVPTKSNVIEQLKEAENLSASGHLRAAFIIGWAALEAAARALNTSDDRNRVMMPRELVEWLAYAGHVDPTTRSRLKELTAIRNAVVHGASDVAPKQADFEGLRAVVDSLIQQVGSPPA